MNFTVYNKSLIPIGLADIYESAIWTERYYEPGDFEIYTIATDELVDLFREDYYIRNSESEYIMIIEHVEISTDVEDGDKLIVKGRSVESILDRRIVLENIKFDSTEESPVKAWEAIKAILDANVISPDDLSRRFVIGGNQTNVIRFDESNLVPPDNDARITDATISASYYGCSVLEAIEAICMSCEMGFKFLLEKDENGYPVFSFHLFKGLDLTTSDDNIYSKVVRFGPFFDNVISSDYLLRMDEYKNVAVVGGKKDANEAQIRQTVLGKVYDQSAQEWVTPSSFNRREMYVDATNLSDKDEDGQTVISDEEYRKRLDNEGYLNLQDLDFTEEFTAEIDPNFNWTYGNQPTDDYYLGDIVIIENKYGMSATARITEVVRSVDTSGESLIPTFSLETFSATDLDKTYSVNSDTEPGKGSGKT